MSCNIAVTKLLKPDSESLEDEAIRRMPSMENELKEALDIKEGIDDESLAESCPKERKVKYANESCVDELEKRDKKRRKREAYQVIIITLVFFPKSFSEFFKLNFLKGTTFRDYESHFFQ